MKHSNIQYRVAKQDGHCRGCDTLISKKDEDQAFYFYSFRNRGQSIILCDECVSHMYHVLVNSSTQLKEDE